MLVANWLRGAIKKERRTKAAPGTLTKGRTEQHLADAPYGARHKLLLLCKSECSLRLVIFLEAGTCASRHYPKNKKGHVFPFTATDLLAVK